jgi:hypothetical protein
VATATAEPAVALQPAAGLPLWAIAPVCHRCGELLSWTRDPRSPDAGVVDDRGRTTCPSPWWIRPLVAQAHTVRPVSLAADLGIGALRAAIAGTALYWAGALVVAVVTSW